MEEINLTKASNVADAAGAHMHMLQNIKLTKEDTVIVVSFKLPI